MIRVKTLPQSWHDAVTFLFPRRLRDIGAGPCGQCGAADLGPGAVHHVERDVVGRAIQESGPVGALHQQLGRRRLRAVEATGPRR